MKSLSALRGSMIVLAAFVAVFSFAGQTHADTTITSNVSTNTTWSPSGGVYIIPYGIAVDSGVTLTIDPGTIVKFQSGAELTINGTLHAQGVATSSVYFTSIKDDSVGGDTNGDGTSSGSAGDWVDITIASGGNATFDYSVIKYGGNPFYTSRADIYNNGGTLTVTDSHIASSTDFGIRMANGTTTITRTDIGAGTYGFYQATGTASIIESNLHDSNYNLNVDAGTLLVASSTFSGTDAAYIDAGVNFTHYGNTASSTGNHISGFLMLGNVTAHRTWTADTMPYVVFYGVTVNSGKTLTVDPGAVVKFYDGSSNISVSGTLAAGLGSASDSIFFTSLKDDLIGGDTNGNSASNSPAAGDWGSISVNAGASATLQRAVVRYGGYGGLSSNIYNNGGTLNISSSTVAYSNSMGIRNSAGTTTVIASDVGYNTYGVYLTGGNITMSATSTIHNNTVSVYNSTGATSSAVATGNYWGDPAGPYNATYNPTGTTTSEVSDYVEFDPWVGKGSASTTLHYIMDDCPSSICASVRDNQILMVSSTTYKTQLDAATTTWNALGSVAIIATTSTETMTLYLSDLDNRPDLVWKGAYGTSTTPAGLLYLNSYYLNSSTNDQIQNTITHELGHALGLDHSYTGNVMYFAQSNQTALGPQDIDDYRYLWH